MNHVGNTLLKDSHELHSLFRTDLHEIIYLACLGQRGQKPYPVQRNIPVSAYFNLEDKPIRNEEVFRINYNRDFEIR